MRLELEMQLCGEWQTNVRRMSHPSPHSSPTQLTPNHNNNNHSILYSAKHPKSLYRVQNPVVIYTYTVIHQSSGTIPKKTRQDRKIKWHSNKDPFSPICRSRISIT